MHGAHTASHRHSSERSHSNARARTSTGTHTPARTRTKSVVPNFHVNSGRGSQSLGGKESREFYRTRRERERTELWRHGRKRRPTVSPLARTHVGTPTADGAEEILGRRKTYYVPKITKPTLQYYCHCDGECTYYYYYYIILLCTIPLPPSSSHRRPRRDICILYRRRACAMYVKVTASATQFKTTQYLAAT